MNPATVTENGSKPTLTKEMIEADRQRRLAECRQKVQELLDEYNCDLVAVPQIAADGRIVAIVQLVAK